MASRFIQLADHDAGAVRIIELSLPRTVDMYEFDRINEEIAAAAQDQPAGRFVLDASHSEYVGSAILGVLVNLRQRVKTGGGRLVICGLSEQLAKALRTCSLYNLFSIAITRDDALKLVKSLR